MRLNRPCWVIACHACAVVPCILSHTHSTLRPRKAASRAVFIASKTSSDLVVVQQHVGDAVRHRKHPAGLGASTAPPKRPLKCSRGAHQLPFDEVQVEEHSLGERLRETDFMRLTAHLDPCFKWLYLHIEPRKWVESFQSSLLSRDSPAGRPYMEPPQEFLVGGMVIRQCQWQNRKLFRPWNG